jgi:energy-coupling factor transporter ATP-binding protein EcfA2
LKLGVVVWAEGVTVKFRIAQGAVVERGMLVKVAGKGRTYILKVVDFKPESLLTPAEVAVISSRADRGEGVQLREKDLRLYDTAISTIVVQIDEDGEVHGPSSVPPLFSAVEELEEGDLRALRLHMGDIPIGKVRFGHKVVDVEVALDGSKTIPHHVLVVGGTGAGKSNFGRVLAGSIMHTRGRYSLVIFDCESEYLLGSKPGEMGLAHLPLSEEYLFLVTDRVQRPGRVRVELPGLGEERSIPAYPLKLDISRLRPSDFTLTGEFSGPQEELLWVAYRQFGEEWVHYLVSGEGRALYSRLGRMSGVNTINVAKRKVRYLTGDGDIFCRDCGYDLAGAVLSMVARGRVVLVETPFATEGEEKLLATVVAERIFRAYEKMRKELPEKWSQLPPVLIMVEEAHRYLGSQVLGGKGEVRENIFTVIAKRGRKYKVGGLYITQMPSELMDAVVRQSLTKVILSLPTRPDYSTMISHSPYLDDAEAEIKTLDRGEAVVVSQPSGFRLAVSTRIYQFEEYAQRLIREEKLALQQRTAQVSNV